jgi:hypothetical protein
MSDEPKKRPRWWMRAWPWWAMLALFVLYPLSLGPLLWVAIHADDNRLALYVFKAAYDPIFIAGEKSEWFRDAMRRYLAMWL